MTHGSLFSGGGGADYAAQLAGWTNMFHCEINTFCQKILKYYWPDAALYTDIRTTDFTVWRGKIDVLTGGFPCQPFSVAGKRKGTEDERHLWPEMLRAIREIEPKWIVGENVRGLINWSDGLVFEQVQADLETEGYEVQPYLLPACAIDAPHRRDRVWFIAYNNNAGSGDGLRDKREWTEVNERQNGQPQFEHRENGGTGNAADTYGASMEGSEKTERERRKCEWIGSEIWGSPGTVGYKPIITDTESEQSERLQSEQRAFSEQEQREFERSDSENGGFDYWENFPTTKPTICSGDDVFPDGLDGITFSKWRQESIKMYGNAWVPELALQLFETINDFELLNH